MRNVFVSALVALVVSFAVIKFYSPQNVSTVETKKASAYDRVVTNQEIKCGYLIYAPSFMVDPNTQKMSGVFYDAVNDIGTALNLRIIWQEEGSYDVLIQSLRDGRIDAICSGLWENAAKASILDFSEPFFFSELAVYARADDTRFDHALEKLNSPDVSFATVEGGIADQIAKNEYPKAKIHALPPLSDFPQLLMEVSSHKADVTISATQEILVYDQNNRQQLRKVITDKPFRMYPNVIFVKKGETDLIHLLNSGLHQIKYTGKLDDIIHAYEKEPGTLLRTRDEFVR